jgi:hypothetical protein
LKVLKKGGVCWGWDLVGRRSRTALWGRRSPRTVWRRPGGLGRGERRGAKQVIAAGSPPRGSALSEGARAGHRQARTAGRPAARRRALEKERLEGVGDQGSGSAAAAAAAAAARATSAGAAPDAPPAAAGDAEPPPPPPPAAPAATSLPPIFRSRPSARFGAPKPRPLYAKLELLLDLVYRRLYWDPTQPDAPFSADALLRAVRKTDKELGP